MVFTNIDTTFNGRTWTLRDLQHVYETGTRPMLNERHRAGEYRITEWVQPLEPDQLHQFHIEGPANNGKVYLALCESCGIEFIRALNRAYAAGWYAGGKDE